VAAALIVAAALLVEQSWLLAGISLALAAVVLFRRW
jgi:ubiquinone biosynthesis protein